MSYPSDLLPAQPAESTLDSQGRLYDQEPGTDDGEDWTLVEVDPTSSRTTEKALLSLPNAAWGNLWFTHHLENGSLRGDYRHPRGFNAVAINSQPPPPSPLPALSPVSKAQAPQRMEALLPSHSNHANESLPHSSLATNHADRGMMAIPKILNPGSYEPSGAQTSESPSTLVATTPTPLNRLWPILSPLSPRQRYYHDKPNSHSNYNPCHLPPNYTMHSEPRQYSTGPVGYDTDGQVGFAMEKSYANQGTSITYENPNAHRKLPLPAPKQYSNYAGEEFSETWEKYQPSKSPFIPPTPVEALINGYLIERSYPRRGSSAEVPVPSESFWTYYRPSSDASELHYTPVSVSNEYRRDAQRELYIGTSCASQREEQVLHGMQIPSPTHAQRCSLDSSSAGTRGAATPYPFVSINHTEPTTSDSEKFTPEEWERPHQTPPCEGIHRPIMLDLSIQSTGGQPFQNQDGQTETGNSGIMDLAKAAIDRARSI